MKPFNYIISKCMANETFLIIVSVVIAIQFYNYWLNGNEYPLDY